MKGISDLKLLQMGRQCVEENRSVEDFAQQLREYYDESEAHLVAQNTLTRVYVQDVENRLQEVRASGLNPALMWRSCGDDQVCRSCASRDGTLRGSEWSEPPPDGCTSSRGCRCVLELHVDR